MMAQGYFGVRTPPGGGGVPSEIKNISFIFKNLKNISPMLEAHLGHDTLIRVLQIDSSRNKLRQSSPDRDSGLALIFSYVCKITLDFEPHLMKSSEFQRLLLSLFSCLQT